MRLFLLTGHLLLAAPSLAQSPLARDVECHAATVDYLGVAKSK